MQTVQFTALLLVLLFSYYLVTDARLDWVRRNDVSESHDTLCGGCHWVLSQITALLFDP